MTETLENDLKVKWSSSKRREKAINADFTFQQNTKIHFVLLKKPKLLQMNSVILNRTPLATTDNDINQSIILRRQVKAITYLTRANNQMKV